MDLSNDYISPASKQAVEYVKAFGDKAKPGNAATFDSMEGAEFIRETHSRNDEGQMPEAVKAVFDHIDTIPDAEAKIDAFDKPSSSELSDRDHLKNKVMKYTLDAMAEYKHEHGEEPSADVVGHAMRLGANMTPDALKGAPLDNATLDAMESMSSDPYSMNPNRPIITIYQSIISAIPFAHMLPMDIGSSEASLIVVGHRAASDFGAYSDSDSMDGIHSGQSYMSSVRTHTLTGSGAAFTGLLTAQYLGPDNCDPDGTKVKWLRGRAQVYINGRVVAKEVSSSGGANSPIAGSIEISGASHAISGTFNSDTGEMNIAVNPALPAGVKVLGESFIDHERSKGLTPVFKTDADKYVMHAAPHRARTEVSVDAREQFRKELKINEETESLLALRNHYANERHYIALQKLMRIGEVDPATHHFDYAGQKAYKNISDIWQDFYGTTWGSASQKMVEDTNDHGLSHMYVGKELLARMRASNLFTDSGVKERPNVFRAGTFSGIQIYYSPRIVNEDIANGTSRALAIGKSSQVARNPIVMGEAVPPIVENVSTNTDHERGKVFYAKNFLEVNPHKPAAMGARVIEFTGLV